MNNKKITTNRLPKTHYMLREIFEQPGVFRRIIRRHLNEEKNKIIFPEFDNYKLWRKKIKRIILLGCGSSYHAAIYGNYLIEELAELNCEAESADEFSNRDAVIEKKTAVIALSQSGETMDTIRAAYLVKKQNVLLIAITNKKKSELSRLSNVVIYLEAGKESAMAATKTFTAELLVLSMLATFIGRQHKLTANVEKIIIKEIMQLPQKAKEILTRENKNIFIKQFKKIKDLAVLGEKLHYPIALEAALKLKEAARIRAEGFAAGEFRHGPAVVVEKNYPSLFFIPLDSVYQNNMKTIKEIRRAKGRIFTVNTRGVKFINGTIPITLGIPQTLEIFYPILSIIPIQLIAYYVAIAKKIRVDSSMNFKKIVR